MLIGMSCSALTRAIQIDPQVVEPEVQADLRANIRLRRASRGDPPR